MLKCAPEARFRALADQTRLRLLALLDQEVCVGDLVDALELPQGTVSRHLATLREAGLVESRRDGVWVYYQRTSDAGPGRALGRVIDGAIAELERAPMDRRRLATIQTEGGCC